MSYTERSLSHLDDETIIELFRFAGLADDDEAADALEAEITRRGLWARGNGG